MSLTVTSGTILVLGPPGTGKSTLINTFLYNMQIPTQKPTRHPRIYRYWLRAPMFGLQIVETVRAVTLVGVQAVIIVPPAGEEGACYLASTVPSLRTLCPDLLLVLVAVPVTAAACIAEVCASLRVPVCTADFKSRTSVFPFFAACVEHCRTDHTWDRRKWLLLERTRLSQLTLI